MDGPLETQSESRPADKHPGPSPHAHSSWAPLRHRHFRNVWIAAFGSSVGTWMEFVAVRWIVSQATNDEVWMGYLSAAQLFPTLLLGMYGGIVADSVNRRSLIVVTQGAMMCIAVAMATAAALGWANQWVLLALCLAQGVTSAFNTPAWQVLTPRLVPREELTRAITLQGIQFNMARVVGPAIGGAIMGVFGPVVLLGFNAATFLALMMIVRTTPDAPAPPELRGKWRDVAGVWPSTREAGRWVFTRRGPRAAFLSLCVFAVFGTPLMQLLPLFVSGVYGKKESVFGIMLALMGAGAVLGGLLVRRVPKWYPMHHFIPLSVMLGGLCILLFSLCPEPISAGICIFFSGIFWMWAFNSSIAALQLLVDDSMRGRVFAVCNTISLGLMPLGTFIAAEAGHLGESLVGRFAPQWMHAGIGTQLGLAFVSSVLLIAGIVMITIRTPEVDGIKPGEPGYERVPGFWRGVLATSHRRHAQGLCAECAYPIGSTTPDAADAQCTECGTPRHRS
ncbi:MAG: MFS transporter [Planctomycetota bacterium]|nr:MFS transporter [Planctomycetota bacterium]